MSQVADFDALIDLFNSSAKVIRDHLASQNANDKIGQAEGNETTFSPLASAPENVRDANKSISEAMARIQQMFLDPVELTTRTTINVSDNNRDWHLPSCKLLVVLIRISLL
jgi:hypothetical protein